MVFYQSVIQIPTTAHCLWSIGGYYQNRSVIEGKRDTLGKKGKGEVSRGFQMISLVYYLIPTVVGQLSSRSLILGSQRPPHPIISQPSISIQPYKYDLIAMVEGRTLKVLLCCWTNSWPKIIWREHREPELELLGMKRWFHGGSCQH